MGKKWDMFIRVIAYADEEIVLSHNSVGGYAYLYLYRNFSQGSAFRNHISYDRGIARSGCTA